jgi:hypothetical protein
MIIWSCVDTPNNKPKEIVWTPVIVKKKYVENETTKDLLFDTGNWHSVNHIIVDSNNKIWQIPAKINQKNTNFFTIKYSFFVPFFIFAISTHICRGISPIRPTPAHSRGAPRAAKPNTNQHFLHTYKLIAPLETITTSLKHSLHSAKHA